jgi:hypothetical protein
MGQLVFTAREEKIMANNSPMRMMQLAQKEFHEGKVKQFATQEELIKFIANVKSIKTGLANLYFNKHLVREGVSSEMKATTIWQRVVKRYFVYLY